MSEIGTDSICLGMIMNSKKLHNIFVTFGNLISKARIFTWKSWYPSGKNLRFDNETIASQMRHLDLSFIRKIRPRSFMQKVWKDLIASDFEQQKTDPHLFPGKASEDLLEKFPPTIILEGEFDQFITEASRLANRLRRAGRLLEFVVFPGANHMSSYMPGTQGNTVLIDTMKTIVKEYVH